MATSTDLDGGDLSIMNFYRKVKQLENDISSSTTNSTFSNGIDVAASSNKLIVNNSNLSFTGSEVHNGPEISFFNASKMTLPAWLIGNSGQANSYQILNSELSGGLSLNLTQNKSNGSTINLLFSSSMFSLKQDDIELQTEDRRQGIVSMKEISGNTSTGIKIFVNNEGTKIKLSADSIVITAPKIEMIAAQMSPPVEIVDLTFATSTTANLYCPYESTYVVGILCRYSLLAPPNNSTKITLTVTTRDISGSSDTLINTIELPTVEHTFLRVRAPELPLDVQAAYLGEKDYIVFKVSDNNAGKLEIRALIQEKN